MTQPSDEAVALLFRTTDTNNIDLEDLVLQFANALEKVVPSAAISSSRQLSPGRVTEVKLRNLDLGDGDAMARCKGITQALESFEQEAGVEIVLQPKALYDLHKQPGLAVFDMDSTLIQQEVIDELARAIGKYDDVATITAAAMRGELDFEASLRARVKLLVGVPTTIWDELKEKTIKFTTGAAQLIACLRALGWKTAVLSGGFTPLAEWVKDTLGLDFASANHLATGVDGNGKAILTGELVEGQPIVHAQRKQDLLKQLAAEYQIPLERTIAVGDGSNDLLMMKVAGLGVAFDAKPKVQAAAPVRLNSGNLLDVMHILGYSKEEFDELGR